MRVLAVLLALALTAAAVPASSLQAMQDQFSKSDECQLTTSPPTCAGVSTTDLIVIYPSGFTIQQQNLFLEAAKAAGSSIVYDWKDFGFSGFVPNGVVPLLKAHAINCGVKIQENACVQIPWCGEAPC